MADISYHEVPRIMLMFMGLFHMLSISTVIPFTGHPFVPLYLTMAGLYPELPIIWGVIGIMSFIVFLVMKKMSLPYATKIFSTVQLSLWAFAAGVYIVGFHFISALGIAGVMTLFWSWNYIEQDRIDEAHTAYKERRLLDNRIKD